ncbi:MAG: TAXI family TRAP transporter solute-binding subunit [Roseomonas sp.]|nr:TAXI family TRAP transporter solute-binding subunit [Roseomonas sp.]
MIFRLILFFCLCFTLPAQALPDTQALKTMIEARIGEATGAGVLAVTSFRSMGQAPDPEGGARIAYFSARLELQRDHAFGSWDGQNLQALAAALGAGSRAIKGANRDGNRKGDMLRVNGALRLRQEAGAWVPLAAAPQESSAASFEGLSARTQRLLAAITTALTASQQAAGGRITPVIEQELALAWRNIEARQARLRDGMPIAGGAEGSEYGRLALAMAQLPPGAGLGQIVALPSAGSIENMRMLADGTAVIAMTQADVAQRALNGGAPEWNLPHVPGLRAIAALYPEFVHVAVPAASSVRRMADLRGKAIGIGAAGSGASMTAEKILLAHGLDANAARRIHLRPEDNAEALASGRVAAVITISLAPAQAMLRLSDHVRIRLLPLEENAMVALLGDAIPLMRGSIPPGTYPEQAEAIATLATPAILVASEAATGAEISALLSRIFEGQGLARTGGPAALMIRKETALAPLLLPFHPAARRFFGAAGQ